MKIWDIIILFLLSAVAGTGIGGGGLFVVYLVAIADYPQNAAQAINLLSFLFAAGVSTWIRLKRSGGRSDIPAVLYCSAVALPGVYLGSLTRQAMEESILRMVFGGILCAVGTIVLIRGFKKKS